MIPELPVADNIFLGREPAGRFGTVDRKRLYAEPRRDLMQRFRISARRRGRGSATSASPSSSSWRSPARSRSRPGS